MPASAARAMVSRWAVEVEGHEATIARLETYLNESLIQATDTFISRLRDIPVIRSQLWDGVGDSAVVGQLAETELAMLQGLTKLAGGASPLRAGTVFELRADDSIVQQTRFSVNDVYVLSDAFDPIPVFRSRLDIVRSSDALSGAVVELSGRADWIKIYKAIEYLEDQYGGEKQLAAAFPKRKDSLKRIKRTANAIRHRARAFTNISSPFKLEDAETLLKSLIDEIISSIAKTSATVSPDSYFIQKRDFPASERIGLRPLILVNGEQSEVAFAGDRLSVRE